METKKGRNSTNIIRVKMILRKVKETGNKHNQKKI